MSLLPKRGYCWHASVHQSRLWPLAGVLRKAYQQLQNVMELLRSNSVTSLALIVTGGLQRL